MTRLCLENPLGYSSIKRMLFFGNERNIFSVFVRFGRKMLMNAIRFQGRLICDMPTLEKHFGKGLAKEVQKRAEKAFLPLQNAGDDFVVQARGPVNFEIAPCLQAGMVEPGAQRGPKGYLGPYSDAYEKTIPNRAVIIGGLLPGLIAGRLKLQQFLNETVQSIQARINPGKL